jgi:hypothetical protein
LQELLHMSEALFEEILILKQMVEGIVQSIERS